MRPHLLTIEGFGPFRDRQTIDFDAVAGDGIFLISGPTGSGKTSILDALCFALFNSVPGPRGSASDLRSHLAAPQDPTRVELVFTAANRRFRIERVPQHRRPRKRGTGMTTQPHTVALSELIDGEWAGISRTAQETESFLNTVIGLNAAQFTKLVLLPQGDFVAFLHADPSEREGILEKLFATEHFHAIERHLAEQATEARRTTERSTEQRRAALQSAADSSWEHLPLPSTAPGLSDALAFLGAAAASAAERAETAATTSALARERALKASGSADAWRERSAARAQLLSLAVEEDAWAADAVNREQRRINVERARTARSLTDRLDSFRRAQNEVSRAEAHAKKAQTAARAAVPRTSRIALEELTDEFLIETRTHLDGIAERLRRRSELESHTATAAAALAGAQTEALKTQKKVGELQESVESLRTAIAAHRADFEELESAVGERDGLLAQQRLYEELATAEAHRDVAHEECVRAEARARETARLLSSIRASLRQNSASALAKLLTEGEPCIVCGSPEHPEPAISATDSPSPDDEREAESQDHTARAALSSAKTTHSAAVSTYEAARHAAEGIVQDDVKSALRRADDAVARRRTLRDQIQRTDERLVTAEAKLKACVDSAKEAENRLHRAQAVHADAESRLAELNDSEAGASSSMNALWGHSTLQDQAAAETAAEELASLTRTHRTWRSQLTALDAARSDAQLRAEDFDRVLAASQFDNAAELEKAAQLPLEQLEADREEDRARGARVELLKSSEQVRRARLDTASGEALSSGTAMAVAHEEHTQAVADAAGQRMAVARAAVDRAQASFTRAEAAFEESRALLEELEQDIDLAELVLGTSTEATSRMSLSSFALARLFADVAAHASERLSDMTGGRYTLIHDFDRRRGERRAGLGLRVIDTFTDESRDPRTLSGGEGFMASLALALGLADTVRGTSGGIELDALFLDEGFGTLDPEALADVLTVLDRLRTGGRTIGIISHVTELQQTITTHIVVEPGPTGAAVRTRSIDG